jgi:hypothetical protein
MARLVAAYFILFLKQHHARIRKVLAEAIRSRQPNDSAADDRNSGHSLSVPPG